MRDIGATLNRYGFTRVQGSVYLSQDENLVNVTRRWLHSRRYPGFPICVRDIRAFKVEHWSDFTDFVKS
jgi:virulence-associated protein VapD